MKKSLRNFLLLSILGITFSACGSVAHVMTQGSNEQYQMALKLFHQKKYEKAILLFNNVDYVYTGTAREDTVVFYTAVSYFQRRDYGMANELLQGFRRRFSRSPFIEEAEYLIGIGYYKQSPEAELDQTTTKLAIIQFNEYINRYPNSVKRTEVMLYTRELMQKLYDKSFLSAKLYYDIGYYKSAIYTFRLSLGEYPESTRREETLYYLTKSCYVYAENSVESLQHERYLEVMDAYQDLIQEYPKTEYLTETTAMYKKAQDFIKSKRSDDADTEATEQQG